MSKTSDLAAIDPDKNIITDSRSVTDPASTVFVALRTATGDGHAYVPRLLADGVRTFVVERVDPRWNAPGDALFVEVSDTLEALRTLGSQARRRLSGTVAGITGSRGKTLLKEMLTQALRGHLSVARSPRSFNSQVGVPLSLWQCNPKAEMCLIEAGVSTVGEMERLEEILNPDIAIITCVTSEHAEGFASRTQQIAEKLRIAKRASTILYNASDAELADAVRRQYPDRRLIPVDTDGPDPVRPFAEAFLALEGIPVNALDAAYPVDTRLSVIDGVNDCRLVVDSFTCDLPSLATALDFVRRRADSSHTLTLVVDTDTFDAPETEIRALASRYGVSRVLTVNAGSAPIPSDTFCNEVVLVKASPNHSLDYLVPRLEAKQHETLLEVNLDAVVSNFNFFRSRLRPATGVVCMLKAQGYGAGSVELARTLQAHGAAYIAVAVTDEGVELRRQGITMPIMVLNPRAENHRTMFDYRLEPEVYSPELLDEIVDAAGRAGAKDFPVHIKLETGMRRLGFVGDDLPELCRRLSATHTLRAASAFSHLACADDPSEDDYTRGQFETFRCYCDYLDAHLPAPPKRHILNSTGILRFPEMQYDMVRLGIGLYGVATLDDGSEDALRCVSTLSTPIISIKHWQAGDSIGYNRRTVLRRDSVIATIPVGYADGIDRHLGNGGAEFAVRGSRCPTVGNICMDICMIDVTDVPEVCVGDRVEVFGTQITPRELADRLTTIPYEILTSVSPRVKRLYYRE